MSAAVHVLGPFTDGEDEPRAPSLTGDMVASVGRKRKRRERHGVRVVQMMEYASPFCSNLRD